MILSLTLFSVGVFCYAIKELQSHRKLKWMKDEEGIGFWDGNSDRRKYKHGYSENGPAFPFSTTALVAFTDGYHLMQFFYTKLFILSIVLYSPVFGWWIDGAIYLGIWYAAFNAVYKIFQK